MGVLQNTVCDIQMCSYSCETAGPHHNLIGSSCSPLKVAKCLLLPPQIAAYCQFYCSCLRLHMGELPFQVPSAWHILFSVPSSMYPLAHRYLARLWYIGGSWLYSMAPLSGSLRSPGHTTTVWERNTLYTHYPSVYSGTSEQGILWANSVPCREVVPISEVK